MHNSPKHLPNSLVIVNPPAYGPKRPLARHLIALLEEWHRQHPTPPPCKYKYRPKNPKPMPFKVFGRDGTELQLACYKIVSPQRYWVLVLCAPGQPDKIVACSSSRARLKTFLVGWAGYEKGYEERCCAVRKFESSLEDVWFSEELWEDEPEDVEPLRLNSESGVNGSKEKKTQKKRKSINSASRRPAPAPARNSLSDEEESAADEPSENESSEEEAPRSKRRRSNRHNRDDNHPDNHPDHDNENNNNKNQSINTTSSTKETHVVFKLISDFADATRSIPSDECMTGKHLFAKAKEFFRLFEPDSEVKVLSCRIPARHERPYLFEGKEGEFRLLLEDLKGSTTGAVNNTLTVEIKCVA